LIRWSAWSAWPAGPVGSITRARLPSRKTKRSHAMAVWLLTYSRALCEETLAKLDADLPRPSDEQRAIVDAVISGASVCVEACAGAGKTTAALHVARAMGCVPVVRTIHSLFRYLYARDVGLMTDVELMRVVLESRAVDAARLAELCFPNGFPKVLIVDEVQDLNAVRFASLCKLVRDARATQLVLVGDSKQTVCAYQGADARYLTFAPQIIPWLAWTRLSLETSWRLTPPMAAYLNEAVEYAGAPRAVRVAAKRARPVTIVHGPKFACVHVAAQTVFDYVFVASYKPEDILVLATKTSFGAASRTGKQTPVQVLVNKLCERLLVYVRSDEHDRAQRVDLSKGKVLVSTIVAAKGAERKVVLFLDHDDAYFQFYARDESGEHCTCAQHVALTRASEVLVVCSDQEGPPRFVRRDAMAKLEQQGMLRLVRAGAKQRVIPKLEARTETVTALLAHVSEHDLCRLEQALPFVQLCAASSSPIVLPSVCSGAWCESVSETNGIALPALLDLDWMRAQLEGLVGAHATLSKRARAANEAITCRAAELVARSPTTKLSASTPRADFESAVAWALEGAALLRASPLFGGFVCNYTQLAFSRFGWMPTETAMRVHASLRAEVGENVDLEVDKDRDGVYGRLDAVVVAGGAGGAGAERRVYEFKCVAGALSAAHKLQLAVYAWLCASDASATSDKTRYVLFNPLSGETWELGDVSDEALSETVRALRDLRLMRSASCDDDEFVATSVRLGLGHCEALEGLVGKLGARGA
jgi:hypothetical protein